MEFAVADSFAPAVHPHDYEHGHSSSNDTFHLIPISSALFTVNSSHLHYNIFAPGCEAVSGKKCKIAQNCLTSTFKNIVMQIRKANREKGYCFLFHLHFVT